MNDEILHRKKKQNQRRPKILAKDLFEKKNSKTQKMDDEKQDGEAVLLIFSFHMLFYK